MSMAASQRRLACRASSLLPAVAGLIEEAVRAGWTIDHADLSTPSEWDDFENHLVRRAAKQAYTETGLTAADMNLAEVHDAAAFGELLHQGWEIPKLPVLLLENSLI